LVFLYLATIFAIAWFSLHPIRTPVFLSPGGLGFPQEEIEFPSTDGILLRGWWSEVSAPEAVVVVSHGYLMNRSELVPLVRLFAEHHTACLFYDFRAHGRSSGKKSFLGFKEKDDVKAAVAWARAKAPGAKIVLIGSSMGAAASALAVGDDFKTADALILDCSYGKLSSAILGWWRFLGGKGLAALLWPRTLVAMPLAGFNPFQVDVGRALSTAGQIPASVCHGDVSAGASGGRL
jgi:alpha-beta hydrolase superfamily lysophospholipase